MFSFSIVLACLAFSVEVKLRMTAIVMLAFLINEWPLNGYSDILASLEVIPPRSRLLVSQFHSLLISGGSSGGSSVTFQLMARGAFDNPPFRAAIAEYPWWQPFLSDTSQELQLSNVLTLANCKNVNCLRSLSASAIQSVDIQSYKTGYMQPGYGYGVFYYGPVVDGKFILELPDQAFKSGRFYDVPLLVDHDRYEGLAFT